MSSISETILELYHKLDYNKKPENTVKTELSALAKSLQQSKVISIDSKEDNAEKAFIKKLVETKAIIKKNLKLFQEICPHVDMITTVLDYLEYHVDVKSKKLSVVGSMFPVPYTDIFKTEFILTLACICGGEKNLFDFLSQSLGLCSSYIHLPTSMPGFTISMIILQDADLHSVIDSLKILKTMKYPTLEKIWVQELIKAKFLLLLIEHFDVSDFNVHGFKSKGEVLDEVAKHHTDIVSIWTENIIAAKNLAAAIKVHLIFINTYMDFDGGIILPGLEEIVNSELTTYKVETYFSRFPPKNFDGTVKKDKIKLENGKMIYELFYGGTWKQPIKDIYYEDEDKNIWAVATNSDIKNCIDLAEVGLKAWSSLSVHKRIILLRNFAYRLQCSGRYDLGQDIISWTATPYTLETSTLYSSSGNREIFVQRKPIGVVIIKAEDENERKLLLQLVQALVAGNSVIVCSIKVIHMIIKYCDMFAACNFPLGVINYLFCDTQALYEISLSSQIYRGLKNCLFDEIPNDNAQEKELLRSLYMQYTVPKYILLPLK